MIPNCGWKKAQCSSSSKGSCGGSSQVACALQPGNLWKHKMDIVMVFPYQFVTFGLTAFWMIMIHCEQTEMQGLWLLFVVIAMVIRPYYNCVFLSALLSCQILIKGCISSLVFGPTCCIYEDVCLCVHYLTYRSGCIWFFLMFQRNPRCYFFNFWLPFLFCIMGV